eukprot:TRINITY_DN3500_c0_g1_i1.p1 TRINITY_DN3500_c0_g1~~TRINITY_DN3500_c0_g1_i1.p1  ORF type:complete len:589 (+),score=88.73 TRINITY_DN3500_c0_g1_i1:74-1840(+)
MWLCICLWTSLSVVTHGASLKTVRPVDVAVFEPAARVSSSTAVSSGASGLRHVVALQAWHRAVEAGLDCPKPRKCECFCECDETEVKDMPKSKWPDPPCIPTTPAPMDISQLPPWPEFPGRVGEPIEMLPLPWGTEKDPLAPAAAPPACEKFYIPREDGTCEYLTQEVIREIRLMVMKRKRHMADLRKENVPEKSKEFVKASDDYRLAVEFLLKVMNLYSQLMNMLNSGPAPAPAGDGLGDGWGDGYGDREFVPREVAQRLDPVYVESLGCEQWTRPNASMDEVEPAICGIMCRQEEACKGFAIDVPKGICVWFTNQTQPKEWEVAASEMVAPALVAPALVAPAPAPSVGALSLAALTAAAPSPAALAAAAPSAAGPGGVLPAGVCTMATRPTFVKVRCIPKHNDLVVAVRKVHRFEDLLAEALRRSKMFEDGLDMHTSHLMTDFEALEAISPGSGYIVASTDRAANANSTENKYQEAIKAVKLLKVALNMAMSEAYDVAFKEVVVNPPVGLPVLRALLTTTTTTTMAVVTTTVPAHLRSLFAWAKRHPGCPRGPPCSCECRCRAPLASDLQPGIPDFLHRPEPKPCV